MASAVQDATSLVAATTIESTSVSACTARAAKAVRGDGAGVRVARLRWCLVMFLTVRSCVESARYPSFVTADLQVSVGHASQNVPVSEDQHQETWHAGRDRWQAITNSRAVPERRLQRELTTPVPVRVRLIWAKDGVEFIDTIALGWAGQVVRVQLHDPRSRAAFVWVHIEHVVRR